MGELHLRHICGHVPTLKPAKRRNGCSVKARHFFCRESLSKVDTSFCHARFSLDGQTPFRSYLVLFQFTSVVQLLAYCLSLFSRSDVSECRLVPSSLVHFLIISIISLVVFPASFQPASSRQYVCECCRHVVAAVSVVRKSKDVGEEFAQEEVFFLESPGTEAIFG